MKFAIVTAANDSGIYSLYLSAHRLSRVVGENIFEKL
jgi:hypothetical protein